MGTGCSENKVGVCPPSDRLSSHCVIWQGESYPQFGICTGDTITEVTEVILNKLIDFSKGEGIFLGNLTAGCPELELKLKQTDYSLYQIVDLLFKENCRLDDLIKKLDAKIDASSKITIDVSCLTSVPVKTRQELDTLFLESICDTKSKLKALTDSLSSGSDDDEDSGVDMLSIIREEIGNFLLAKLNSCNGVVQKTGTGSSAEFNIIGVPLRGCVWGDFDLTKFGSNGLGTGIYCNFALANGLNGTIDMRGYNASMATTIPGVARTFDITQAPNSVAGTNFSKLTIANMVPHEHNISVNQTPHRHEWYEGRIPQNTYVQTVMGTGTLSGSGTPITIYSQGSGIHGGSFKLYTSEENVNLSVSISGTTGAKSESFENRQPTRYGVWIQRIK